MAGSRKGKVARRPVTCYPVQRPIWGLRPYMLAPLTHPTTEPSMPQRSYVTSATSTCTPFSSKAA